MAGSKQMVLVRNVARELKISTRALTDLLDDVGFDIENSPNAKITFEQLKDLKKALKENQIDIIDRKFLYDNKTKVDSKHSNEPYDFSLFAKKMIEIPQFISTNQSEPENAATDEEGFSLEHNANEPGKTDEDYISDELNLNPEELNEFSNEHYINEEEELEEEDSEEEDSEEEEDSKREQISPQVEKTETEDHEPAYKHLIEQAIALNSEEINLSNLELAEIPEALASAKHLKVIDLSHNKITQISNLPDGVTVLLLSNNRLAKLENLPENLSRLVVDENRLANLGKIPGNLIFLDASHNQITEINYIPGTTEELNLNHNKLKSFNISHNLKTLSICSNELTSIPPIEELESLNALYIYDNPLLDIPVDLIGPAVDYNCLNGIRSYTKELERKSEKNTNIKLILLGNSNVGKSSIVKALKRSPVDKDIKSTHAINLDLITMKESDQTVNLQVWDLGGQEIYYGTHRIFMVSSSVQMVVFDSDTEAMSVSPDRLKDGEKIRNITLPFYINRVEELSPSSQVIIVQNKIEQNAQIPEYLRDYSLKYRFEKISVHNNRNIKSLSASIFDASLELNIYGREVPYYWERVRKYYIRNLEKPVNSRDKIIDKEKFREVCLKEKVLEEGIDELLKHLHNTGTIYYLENLGNHIIVDQVWALKAIYKIFDREKDSNFYFELRKIYYGKCTVRTLFNDFDKTDDAYTIDEKWIFLKFMESCGLCFSLLEDINDAESLDTFYVFPEFLPSNKPSFVKLWELKKSTRLVVKKTYSFLPYYPLHTFISKLGPKTMHNFLWRNGILIIIDNTMFDGFLVEADFAKHTIQITIDVNVLEWLDAVKECLQIKGDTLSESWITIKRDDPEDDNLLAAKKNKTTSELSQLENVPQEKGLDVLQTSFKKRLVISYAKEDVEEVRLLIKYLDANNLDYWYDLALSNRETWATEVENEFNNADGYIVILSPDYMTRNKKFIHEKEVPLILNRMSNLKKFCTVLCVRSFTLNDKIHTVGKFPIYNKGAILPDLGKNYYDSCTFMNEFVRTEILKKF